MSKFNFFERVSVSTVDFEDHVSSFGFISSGISLINTSSLAGDVVEYSFDGSTLHGDLSPTFPNAALAFDNRFESRIWFRLKVAGPSAIIRVEAWAVG